MLLDWSYSRQPHPACPGAPEGHEDLRAPWVGAGDLKPGDRVRQANGTAGTVVLVENTLEQRGCTTRTSPLQIPSTWRMASGWCTTLSSVRRISSADPSLWERSTSKSQRWFCVQKPGGTAPRTARRLLQGIRGTNRRCQWRWTAAFGNW